MKVFEKSVPVWSQKKCVNQYVCFRQSFCLEEITELSLNIRAHSNYIIYINKIPVSFGQYQDYSFYKVYDSCKIPVDILKKENTVDILAYYQGESTSTYRVAEPSLIFEILQGKEPVCVSSENTLYSDNTGYKSGEIEKITLQLAFTFEFDCKIDFLENEDKLYKKPIVLQDNKKYFKRPVKKLEITEKVPTECVFKGSFADTQGESPAMKMHRAFLSTVENIGDGSCYIFDIKRETAGYLNLEIELDKNCDIIAGYGEHLEDLRVRSFVGNRNFAFLLHGKKGVNKFVYPFTRVAGRYIQLHIYSHNSKVNYCGVNKAEYPLKSIVSFKSEDKLQEEIYNISIDTLRLCMHEHYEDCPWREQALYAMDARNQMLCGYYAFGEYTFAKESLRLLALSQRDDGLMELCAPAEVPITIPVFSLMWITALYEYYIYSGDTAFVKKMLPVAKKVFANFKKENGLFLNPVGKQYWNFYEWNEGLDGEKFSYRLDSGLNLFYLFSLKNFVELLKLLGEDNSFYEKEKKNLARAINSTFYKKEKGGYIFSLEKEETPELIQVLALCCDIVSNKKSLAQKVMKDSFMPKCTLSHTIFKYDALLYNQENKRYVFEQINKIWGDMIKKGATSFWETQKGAADFDNAGSLCHGWSAIPVYIYLKHKQKNP
ncbi:MAG: hypothetical protein E7480_00225 [Ruminococcaceae bacterium]|nr:hypothetical protein [Oscillospiraceae bacterium]